MEDLIIINSEDYGDLTFSKPSKIDYGNVLAEISKKDYYSAIDIIIKNCYQKEEGGLDLKNNEPAKISLVAEISEKFFDFKNVDIITDYSGEKYADEYAKLLKGNRFIFTVIINDDAVLFLRPMENKDYKRLLNLSIISTKAATDYIMEEMLLEGDNVITNVDYYVACFGVADHLLKFKEETIKKK